MRIIAFLCVSSLFLTSCATPTLRSATASKEPTLATSREATVIYIPPTPGTLSAGNDVGTSVCNLQPTGANENPEAGGLVPLLLAPLVGVAVDAAVSAASSQLAKEQSAVNATWSASSTTALKPAETSDVTKSTTYCFALSRGTIQSFGSGDGKAPAALGDLANFSGTPVFVLLAQIEVVAADNGEFVTISPELLSYADTSAARTGTGKKDVSVILSFASSGTTQSTTIKSGGNATDGSSSESGGGAGSGHPARSPKKPSGRHAGTSSASGQSNMPTKDANDGTGASGNKTATTQQNSSEQAGTIRLDFGRLEVGRVYGPNLLKTVNSGVFLKPGPYTVTAIVTESEDPSVALTALSAALTKDQGDLSTALKQTILDALGDKTSSTSSK